MSWDRRVLIVSPPSRSLPDCQSCNYTPKASSPRVFLQRYRQRYRPRGKFRRLAHPDTPGPCLLRTRDAARYLSSGIYQYARHRVGLPRLAGPARRSREAGRQAHVPGNMRLGPNSTQPYLPNSHISTSRPCRQLPFPRKREAKPGVLRRDLNNFLQGFDGRGNDKGRGCGCQTKRQGRGGGEEAGRGKRVAQIQPDPDRLSPLGVLCRYVSGSRHGPDLAWLDLLSLWIYTHMIACSLPACHTMVVGRGRAREGGRGSRCRDGGSWLT